MEISEADRQLAEAVEIAARAYVDALVKAADAGLEIEQFVSLQSVHTVGAAQVRHIPNVSISISRVVRGVIVDTSRDAGIIRPDREVTR